MNRIKIESLETLFFKDGKPFSMGDETWADGIFPPAPSVIYGALRTAYFNNQGDIQNAGTPDDPTKNLRITDFFLSIEGGIFLPSPADLVVKSNDFKSNPNEPKLFPLSLKKKSLIGNYDLSSILTYEGVELVEYNENLMINSSVFHQYLSNNLDSLAAINIQNFIISEPKTGIGRDNTSRSTSEGKLYRVGLNRLEAKGFSNKKLSFVVGFDGIELPENGVLKLGAEGKLAKYQSVADSDALGNHIQPPETVDKCIKLILLTPAFLTNGSLPNINLERFSKYNMKLISAAIPGYISIGGFDMKKNHPKFMRRALKAGSVLYFSFEGSADEVIKEFHMKSISEYGTEKEGFGIVAVGKL